MIIVIPFTAAEAAKTERLLDHIFHIGGVPGHVLLVSAHDVHAEARERIKVAADVAFSSFEMIAVAASPSKSKDERINQMFKQTAKYIQETYRLPWFLMEPDCTPKEGWYHKLVAAYNVQPKRYCGVFFKAGDLIFCSRRIIYPFDAYNDLAKFCDDTKPFNVAAASVVVPKATKSPIVQEIVIDSNVDLGKVSANVSIVHSDKNSVLLSHLEGLSQPGKKDGNSVHA